MIKDLPNVVHSNYLMVTGTVTKEGAKPEYALRRIYVSSSQMTTECKVHEDTYELGKCYEIIYLPYTKIGVVVRELEEGECEDLVQED